jgi:SAM-dependent methyltransferase
MAEVIEAFKQAKQKFKMTPLQEVSCRWCESRALKDLGEVKGYSFVECWNCGFTFCPYISQELMDRLYALGYHASEEGVPEFGWSKPGFLEPALALFTPEESLKILDFGCGQSIVPEKLRRQGHKVIAVDVTEPIRPHPERLTGNILDLHLESDQFDLVYSFQVFEHLPNPVPILHELLRLSKPHGYILIHTDMEPPERREGFQEWWYVLPPDHCSFYKIKSFHKILEGSPHLLVEGTPKYVIIQKNGKINRRWGNCREV